jgi:2-keto-3-deoxy-L-rhamnonate aldolase RhmA
MTANDNAPVIRNNVLERLSNDKLVVSLQVRLVESIEIAHIAKAAGFDTLYIDLEHCAMTLRDVSQICVAAIVAGITPMVRVGNLAHDHVSRVLDIGALGIIAPHIRSAEDAAAVVSACKFPPLGERSVSAGLPHLGYRNLPVSEARRAINDATAVVVMIETPAALDNVEAIAAVEGVDLLLIGTNDLCSEWGIPGEFGHSKVRDAYRRVIGACRKHGIHAGVGGLSGRPDLVKEFVAMGARFVSSGSDLQFLLASATERANAVRKLHE